MPAQLMPQNNPIRIVYPCVCARIAYAPTILALDIHNLVRPDAIRGVIRVRVVSTTAAKRGEVIPQSNRDHSRSRDCGANATAAAICRVLLLVHHPDLRR